jgi:hypothetical protein
LRQGKCSPTLEWEKTFWIWIKSITHGYEGIHKTQILSPTQEIENIDLP